MKLIDVTDWIMIACAGSTVLFGLLTVPTANAQGQAHVHGVAQLVLAQDRNSLHIEFISPGINIVGFEHSPQNDVQRQAVDDALTLLAGTDSILQLSALDCVLDNAQAVTTGQFSFHNGDHRHEHNHNHNHHDDQHAGFTVVFELSCAGTPFPSELVLTAFSNFPGLESIEALWALEGSQGARHLPRSNTRLRVRQ